MIRRGGRTPRIARELHDDIGRRLALLFPTWHNHQVPGRFGWSSQPCRRIEESNFRDGDRYPNLSHRLRSSKLEYLGLATAMRSFCKEFGEQQKVEIDFETHDLPSACRPKFLFVFFRVLQEALQNSVKYGGVRQIAVRSWGTPNKVRLTVSDFGSGFDIEAAKAGRGLGLISMDERLKILNGTLRSNPNSSVVQRSTLLCLSVRRQFCGVALRCRVERYVA